jgi:two-component system, OmpR family, phosphate regulon sensor histidine kinase PhoR
MYKGGPSYTPHTALIFKYAGLIIPLVLAGYSFLVQINVLEATSSLTFFNLSIFSFWWLAIGIIQFFIPSKSKFDAGMRLVAYHLLAGSCLLFITGVASPIAICWVILLIMSYTYFSRIGFEISLIAFVFVVMIDMAIEGLGSASTYDVLNSDLITLAALLITSMVILGITRSQEIILQTLDKTRALESLQRDRNMTLVNNLTYAIVSTDINGIVKVYNAATLNLLDTNENLNGRHIDEILKLKDQDHNDINIFKELQRSKSTIKREDLDYKFLDGETIRLEITYSPIRSSYGSHKKKGDDGYIIIMRDITKAKTLEEERDEFISVVSHELRTPITIAEGSLSNVIMMMDKPKIPAKILRDSVTMAHDQIIFLSSMVNDLSTLSRAERGVADSTEDIDVSDFAHKLINKYHSEAASKGLMLNLDMSPKVGKIHASRLYFEEIIQNFITNAIKYTKTGTITVTIKQKGDEVNFAIKDSGIGISKSDQEKIFDKFYRSEDYRTRETGGTGLGLYVAAKLARKLGTHIEVTSRLNHGSTFSFSMPTTKE